MATFYGMLQYNQGYRLKFYIRGANIKILYMTTRRSFIQTLSAPLVSLPFLSFKEDEKPFEGPILRVAIMGFGSYGNRLADPMKSLQ